MHNSSVGHWGQAKCKRTLNDPSISDRMISTFIRQCPCCQVTSRLKVQIKTQPFTCALYNPFEVIHLDHIDPLRPDAHGNMFILVLIDAFSRRVELFPTKTMTALESTACIFQHIGRRSSSHRPWNSLPQRVSFRTTPCVRYRAVVYDSILHRKKWYR